MVSASGTAFDEYDSTIVASRNCLKVRRSPSVMVSLYENGVNRLASFFVFVCARMACPRQ